MRARHACLAFLLLLVGGGIAGSASLVGGADTPVEGLALSIDEDSIDGGGGSQVGGVYSLTGTIGQSDAGKSAAGVFSLTGGIHPSASGLLFYDGFETGDTAGW